MDEKFRSIVWFPSNKISGSGIVHLALSLISFGMRSRALSKRDS